MLPLIPHASTALRLARVATAHRAPQSAGMATLKESASTIIKCGHHHSYHKRMMKMMLRLLSCSSEITAIRFGINGVAGTFTVDTDET
jgi:hypothetical protein